MLLDNRLYATDTRLLVYLLTNIERLNHLGYLNCILKTDKLVLIESESLNATIEKEGNYRYLRCGDPKIGMKPFSIRLGSGTKLINKRVINELGVKTYCAIRGISISQHCRYVDYLFTEKIMLAFDYAVIDLKWGILSSMMNRGSRVEVSQFWGKFSEDFAFDASIELKRNLLGTYTVQMNGCYSPINLLETHYSFVIKGNKDSIKYEFHKALVKVLNR